jgi:hypothetical protein
MSILVSPEDIDSSGICVSKNYMDIDKSADIDL